MAHGPGSSTRCCTASQAVRAGCRATGGRHLLVERLLLTSPRLVLPTHARPRYPGTTTVWLMTVTTRAASPSADQTRQRSTRHSTAESQAAAPWPSQTARTQVLLCAGVSAGMSARTALSGGDMQELNS